MRANLSLKPESQPEPGIDQAFARFSYSRVITGDTADAAGEPAATARVAATADARPVTETVVATERIRLDAEGNAEIDVDGFPDNGRASVRIENSQGEIVMAERSFVLTRTDDTSFLGTLTYDAGAIARALSPAAVGAVPVLNRAGQYRRTAGTAQSFERSRLQIAVLRSDEQTELLAWVDDENGRLPDLARPFTRFLSRDALGDVVESQLTFTPADLKTDGGFNFKITIADGVTGWIWLLTESDGAYAGWIPEAQPDRPRDPLLILLPPMPAADATRPGGDSDVVPRPDPTKDPCACPDGRTPLDFDEDQLLRDPASFSDDPGRFCTPFENPQRVIGERRFMTVFRVDQPDISGAASADDDALPLHDLFANTLSATAGRGETLSRVVNPTAFTTLIKNPLRRLRLRASTGVRRPVSATNSIQWESESSLYQAASVAGGHILEWAIQYRSNGYSLGDVAYTLTLAPRQKRRVVSISWERRERAQRREQTAFAEQVQQATTRERDYDNAVRSSLREWSRGSSESSTTGVAGGIGFALGPVVIGGGAAHGTASSSASQTSGRDLSASEEQNLRDAIRQYGDSLRRFESTVVQEVTQEESVEGVSEVVYNINYCHSLTVLYHQILRHLRVDTRLVGVRECLFVPFAIRPFDVRRALQWRDLLRRGVREGEFRRALEYLDEVAENFANSDIPPGARSSHPIRFITGSIYIKLGIERPTEDQATAEAAWLRISRILGLPYRQIITRLLALEASRRDAQFQQEVAPTMAVRWANRLRLDSRTGTLEGVDFTLASAYAYNRTVRVDFTVSIPEGTTVTRADLSQITVRAEHVLPKGSVANLERVELTYQTDYFTRSVSSARTTNDLIDIDTGNPDPSGGLLALPLTTWETQNERTQIIRAVERLVSHLNANIEYYHKVIWWNLDRDRLYMMLDGFLIGPGAGRSIASVVEREPIAILGNALVYPVSAGAFLGVGGHKTPIDVLDYYRESDRPREPVRISLPTEGLYAQAIIDRCNATEEHQGSHDWVLSQEEPQLELLSQELLATRRSEPAGTTPTPFPQSIINLQNAPEAPAPTGLGSVLDAVTRGDAFRDITGLAGTQANALGALQAAAGLAESFGQKALDLRNGERRWPNIVSPTFAARAKRA